MDGLNLKRVEYMELSGKQQEIYNFQKVAARLADYGFNCIKLDDDWMGADFLAYHKDGKQTLKVQLKGRLTIRENYVGKDLYICFPHRGDHRDDWYLVPHDRLFDLVGATTNWLNTSSWQKGRYSSAKPSRRLLMKLTPYRIEFVKG